MVKDVEHLSAELQVLPFGDFEILESREVKVHLIRPDKIAIPGCAKLVSGALTGRKRRLDKGSWVVPAQERSVARIVAPIERLLLGYKLHAGRLF